MKIKEITSQHRRDFRAIYVCEHCGHEENGTGYDDSNFHQNVIPTMKCKKCGEVAPKDYAPKQTKYPEGFQI
jgi:transcription elongation factor Elf1